MHNEAGEPTTTASLKDCPQSEPQTLTPSSGSSTLNNDAPDSLRASRPWPSGRINCLTPFVAPWPDSNEQPEHE